MHALNVVIEIDCGWLTRPTPAGAPTTVGQEKSLSHCTHVKVSNLAVGGRILVTITPIFVVVWVDPDGKKTPNHRHRCQKGARFKGRWRLKTTISGLVSGEGRVDVAHAGSRDAACRRRRRD
ncbi:hypothetical protein DVH24_038753 [Malus domestica]|uniref:Uncharacterized protein n=1 Tax=Malus domestica TaxID=3750 RepID=A0A498K871_MALDO|nr:hypothetical protein DVH24_038753 [Malus domestica]